MMRDGRPLARAFNCAGERFPSEFLSGRIASRFKDPDQIILCIGRNKPDVD